MAQSVSRRPLTTEARVRTQIIPLGFREAKIWHFVKIFPRTFRTPVITFTLALYTYSMTTVHAT